MKVKVVLMVIAVFLAGCGEKDYGEDGMNNEATTFNELVRSIFTNSSDAAEPVEINELALEEMGESDDFSDLL